MSGEDILEGQDNRVPQPIGTISTSHIMPGLFLETQDGQVTILRGLVAMDDGTVRWAAPNGAGLTL